MENNCIKINGKVIKRPDTELPDNLETEFYVETWEIEGKWEFDSAEELARFVVEREGFDDEKYKNILNTLEKGKRFKAQYEVVNYYDGRCLKGYLIEPIEERREENAI